MKLSANFALAEFNRPFVPEDYPAEWQSTKLVALVAVLQFVRDCAGTPGIVTSAYRSAARNAAIGGSATSQHIDGDAADVLFALTPLRELVRAVLTRIADAPAFGQLVFYKDKGHVHASNPAPRLGARNGQVLYSPGLDTSSGARVYVPLTPADVTELDVIVPQFSDPQKRGSLWLGAIVGAAALWYIIRPRATRRAR